MELGASIAFWILAATSVMSALAVILLRDVFRAALFLVLTFLAVAGLFVTLRADFLAAVQVLIYAGAIAILIIFAIMLTRNVQSGNPSNRLLGAVSFLSAILLAAIVYVALNTHWPQAKEAPLEATTGPLADFIFNKYVLPFELASVLLLAAIVGAIVLVKEK
ncbi:MAG: NADH-quinone oxidoreductase subunit J [Chloroflexi bacterium]|nr:NADH-quinone oxidoreductase subunit J [Chloroflexota bacterium]